MDLTYRVSTGEQSFRYGSFTEWEQTPQELADRLAEETRNGRPDVTGPLTVHVWPSRVEEHYRLLVPEGAQQFNYPA